MSDPDGFSPQVALLLHFLQQRAAIVERVERVFAPAVTVRLRATDAEGHSGTFRKTFFVRPDPDHVDGFPVDMGEGGESSPLHLDVFALVAEKSELLRRARRDLSIKARLELWLYLHVPLSLGSLGTLIAHVVSVFLYW